jgi:hypothetical protein
MRSSHILCLVGALLITSSPAQARKPKNAWSVSRVQDPITGASSCVVTAPDQFGRMKYSRFSYLYPVVENNSQLGLLIGVSSGGQYRVPTGDILWRVDANPFRQLRAADNPPGMPTITPAAPTPTGNPQVDKAMADAIANAARLTAAYTSTSTVASGPKAVEMLREMVEGRSLLYRQAAAAPAYGLPSSQTYAVGQWTGDELRPIPLDESFRRGLAECGISPPPSLGSGAH